MTWLIRLYPARWRERYGEELERLVHDLRPGSTVGERSRGEAARTLATVRRGA